MNRFTGLDLVDRVPKEYGHKAVTKTIPKKTKCMMAGWLSEESLQISKKRREVKGKGERERYTHTELNAEFHKIARRDKKAFLNEQYEEIEDNDRIGKTRSLQQNRRYQENISCKDEHDKRQKQ